MCLAIPAKISKIDADNLATVDILGVTREASIDLTPQARVGDYVLIHAGFAIEVVSEEYAQETLDLINEFPELAAEGMVEEAGSAPTGGPSLGALLSE
ncbi:MAG: HypC/HybG/HupF family hydrogenase formation chaperone [Eggerthellaceae bacterium]|jgi:hydrogenase expression/formation protein HypC|nr:HypC/HybG/HupF family hydrogenase formation chaperone [Eggerthellaceae bacterium]MDR2721695.1 HypC/HybG/HupF family hydrogenase formation chaperone [Coriobacteriaceae bacterium]